MPIQTILRVIIISLIPDHPAPLPATKDVTIVYLTERRAQELGTMVRVQAENFITIPYVMQTACMHVQVFLIPEVYVLPEQEVLVSVEPLKKAANV